MTQHNIIGSERPGPHIVVRRFAPARRPVSDRVLIAIGACTIVVSLLVAISAALP